jgi:hypothetical protein
MDRNEQEPVEPVKIESREDSRPDNESAEEQRRAMEENSSPRNMRHGHEYRYDHGWARRRRRTPKKGMPL